MKKTMQLYINESKKIFTAKGFVIFLVILLLLCLIVAFSQIIVGDLLGVEGDIINGNYGGDAEQLLEDVNIQIEQYEKAVEAGEIEVKFYDTTLQNLKTKALVYKYLADNDINLSNVMFLNSYSLGQKSAVDFVLLMMQTVGQFCTIMAIVVVAKLCIGERENGTMRMQLVRPHKRTALLTSKMMAAFTSAVVVIVVFTVLAQLVGALFFKGSIKQIIVTDGVKNVALINPYTAFFITALSSLVAIWLLMQLTVFVGNFASTTASIVVPIIVFLLGSVISALLTKTGLPWIGIMTNLNWISALSLSGTSFVGMNIYTMVAITLLWSVGLTVANYLIFKKRDLK